MELLNGIQLSRVTVGRHIENLSEDIVRSIKEAVQRFKYFSIALVESTDYSDTAQIAIMVREVDNNLVITEEFLTVSSLH